MNAGYLELPRELAGKDDVGKFRALVGPPSAVGPGTLHFVEVYLDAAMRLECDIDDTRRRRGDETLAQKRRQPAVSDVVERESEFQSARSRLLPRVDGAGVVDQDVFARRCSENGVYEAAHLIDLRQVGVVHLGENIGDVTAQTLVRRVVLIDLAQNAHLPIF